MVLTSCGVARHRERAAARWARAPARTRRRSTSRCRTRWRSTSTAGSGSPTCSSARCATIELKNWVADADPGLGAGHRSCRPTPRRRIGQTSILGTQHVELDAPPNPSPQPLKNGDTIPLKNSSAFPTTERTLASIATVLRGGGIPNLEVIQTEVNNLLTGNADQIREFLNKLDTFTAELNKQRDDIDARDRLDQPAVRLSWPAATTRWTGCSPNLPPLIKLFRRHQRPVRRRGRWRSDGSARSTGTRCRPPQRQPAHQPRAAAAAAEAAGPGVRRTSSSALKLIITDPYPLDEHAEGRSAVTTSTCRSSST